VSRSKLKIVRRVVGLALLVVAIPGSIVATRAVSLGSDRVFGYGATRALIVCVTLALIGASMVGKLKLPVRRSKRYSESADSAD
jgi:hypothetical protein